MRILKILFFAIVLFVEKSVAQDVIYQLTPNGEYFSDSEYQYLEVIDKRRNSKILGEIFDEKGNRNSVKLAGSVEKEVLNLFQDKVKTNSNAIHRILVHITELQLQEKFNSATRLYDGGIKLKLSYFLIGKADPIPLVDYEGSLTYRRTANRSSQVKYVANAIFHKSLEFFDGWEKAQNLGNPNLARQVRLEITDVLRESSKDTVFYHPQRPLNWGDFQDSPKATSKFNATIFTSFSMAGNSTMDEGVIVQNLDFKIYMLPKQSWVKHASDYGIDHEQLHFDVVRIVVDRLIQRLKGLELDPEFFQATLNEEYLDALRELTKIQELYDGQTNHGLNIVKQAEWESRIKNALNGDWEEIDNMLEK